MSSNTPEDGGRMSSSCSTLVIIEPRHEKTCLRGFRPGKTPTCAATETSKSLEIAAIASRGIILSKKANNKGADQTARMRRLICAFVVRI